MISPTTFKDIDRKDWKAANAGTAGPSPKERTLRFYRRVLEILDAEKLPYLVGGAYAFRHYTGIARYTKDLDVFVRPSDCEGVLRALQREGYRTELTFRHWLAKAINSDGNFVDVIFGSGNGICEVDDAWFEHAESNTFMGRPVRIAPCEEMLWSKAYILERDRCDVADVAHLLRARADRMDWQRLVSRFGDHADLLAAHLLLFRFIYPSEVERIPADVMTKLTSMKWNGTVGPVCRGTLLSYAQYRKDVEEWGYQDARLHPLGHMTRDDIDQWVAAFQPGSGPGK